MDSIMNSIIDVVIVLDAAVLMAFAEYLILQRLKRKWRTSGKLEVK